MSELTRALRSSICRAAAAVSERLWDRLHATYGLTDGRAKVELYGHLLGMLTGFLDGILPDGDDRQATPDPRPTPIQGGG